MTKKSYGILYIDGQKIPTYGSHTGGATNPVMTEVPLSNRPNTMRQEPSGGYEFEALEITFSEKTSEGFYLTEVRDLLTRWRDERRSGVPVRKAVRLEWYKDENFREILETRTWTNCYPSVIGEMEGDRSSSDARELTATIVHETVPEVA